MLKSITSSHTNFDEIADVILNRSILIAKDKTFRICEIEFYYCGKNHMDTYTHCSDEQKMKCKFYFHRLKNGTYKSGTYKCLDMTLSPDNETYFGILIRSLYDYDDKKFIEGPCNSVNEILKQFSCHDVKEFVNGKVLPLDIYDEKYEFYLADTENMKHEQIYQGSRIGLSDKYPDFQLKPYRYATKIENIKKQRKTFKKIH